MAKEIKAIGKKAGKKDEKKQIISRDLMHNFQISMAKFSSVSVEEFVRMVIHCDKRILDDPVVMEFLQKNDFCDIPDNTAKLMAPYSKDWTGPNAGASKREQDPGELTREDQIYLYTAYELHGYWKSRMRALAMTRTYEAEYDEISNKLLEISRVSESLRDSTSLISVLGLILDIGNFMNDANKQANGFKLSTLSRLGMLKDDKNESTFADLVERIVRNQYSGWEGFTDEISGVITAQKINVEQLVQDAKKYIDNIKNIQMSLDAGNLSDPSKFHPEDKFTIIVQRSMKEARRKSEQLQVFLEDMQKSYDDIMAFYGEDPTDDNSRREFFAKLANFVQEWKVSRTNAYPSTSVSLSVSKIRCELFADPCTALQRKERPARRTTSPQRDLHASQTTNSKPPLTRSIIFRLRRAQIARLHRRYGRLTPETPGREARSKRSKRPPSPCSPQGQTPGTRGQWPENPRTRGQPGPRESRSRRRQARCLAPQRRRRERGSHSCSHCGRSRHRGPRSRHARGPARRLITQQGRLTIRPTAP
jgi:hypothetical protein